MNEEEQPAVPVGRLSTGGSTPSPRAVVIVGGAVQSGTVVQVAFTVTGGADGAEGLVLAELLLDRGGRRVLGRASRSALRAWLAQPVGDFKIRDLSLRATPAAEPGLTGVSLAVADVGVVLVAEESLKRLRGTV